ncbi:hypothetical protein PHSY_001772 [Pseudozyma hubeiensis SY62]|uniref:Uncharacterized protein n=1 Tax=Pseudozyma hubeiensis (strain SY62) TaxID=1305764 RepID=R9NZJ2_PSEHS|nr:hypothetical protein PHSY_001772 [Pseudozyma hubeiensis SY62]GAC94201.1 hypothetical protein PHSY_001772 [Pseudozyma hubeiensis SY62]
MDGATRCGRGKIESCPVRDASNAQMTGVLNRSIHQRRHTDSDRLEEIIVRSSQYRASSPSTVHPIRSLGTCTVSSPSEKPTPAYPRIDRILRWASSLKLKAANSTRVSASTLLALRIASFSSLGSA